MVAKIEQEALVEKQQKEHQEALEKAKSEQEALEKARNEQEAALERTLRAQVFRFI
jgi:hypothetical protein